MSLEEEELTGKIIGAAIDVHRELGPGFIESFYENALVIRLKEIGLKSKQQDPIIVYFHGIQVGKHRLDLIVEQKIVVDLKSVKAFESAHFSVVRSQLRACGLRHGLLLNFSKPALEIKRVIADSSSPTDP